MAWNLKEFNTVVLPLVKARLTTAQTIAMDVKVDAGRAGGTVDFESPFIVQGEARVHTQADRDARNAFVFDEVETTNTPITLSDYVYKGTALTYDMTTFSIVNLKDVINQSASVVARKINSIAGALLQAEIDAADVVALPEDEDAAVKVVLRHVLRTKTSMDEIGVDTFRRTLAVSPLIGEILLTADQFSSADRAGVPDALREATIGRVYGFDVVIDNTLSGLGFVAYENYAFGLVVRPAAKPMSNVVESETTIDAEGKMVLNSTVDYDINQKTDKLITGAFVGAAKLDPARSSAVRFSVSAG